MRWLLPLLLATPAVAQNDKYPGDKRDSYTVHWCVWTTAPGVSEDRCDEWGIPDATTASKVRDYAVKQAQKYMTAAEVKEAIKGKSITRISGGEISKNWSFTKDANTYVYIVTWDEANAIPTYNKP